MQYFAEKIISETEGDVHEDPKTSVSETNEPGKVSVAKPTETKSEKSAAVVSNQSVD